MMIVGRGVLRNLKQKGSRQSYNWVTAWERDDPFRFSINISHELDLRGLFFRVRLINTDGVNPDTS